MLALSGMQRWVRPGVFIDATTITEDAQGLGAFAPRGSITRKSSFLGVYRATKWRVQKRRYSGNNDYVMQCGDWLAIPQGRICKRQGCAYRGGGRAQRYRMDCVHALLCQSPLSEAGHSQKSGRIIAITSALSAARAFTCLASLSLSE